MNKKKLGIYKKLFTFHIYRRLIIFFEMTEVFISALSTTRLDLNEEDLEFYLDEKNKEILDVRQALDYLNHFSSSTIKERMQMNYNLVWKGINFLAKILGYENELDSINKLQLPENILLHDLITSHGIFNRKSYRAFQVASRWNGKVQIYVILLEGVIEREVIRNSFMDRSGGGSLLMRQDSVGKKKNNRKRFTRTDQQIPICLNSKRNELRNLEQNAGFFRSLTQSEFFEVDVAGWKKYVDNLQRLQNHYLMSFIRKKLNISLNLDLQKKAVAQKEKQEGQFEVPKSESEVKKPEKIYRLASYERKTSFDLHNNSLFLLYSGQVLIETAEYKIQTSRGCILNTVVFDSFYLHKQCERINLGRATPKTDCVVIELDLIKLLTQFEFEPEDYKILQQLLQKFQNTRKNSESSMMKGDRPSRLYIQRNTNTESNSFLCNMNVHYSSKSPTTRNNKFTLTQIFKTKSKNSTFLPNCKGQLSRRNDSESELRKGRNNTKIFPCQQIQNHIIKTQKAAELIKNQQMMKGQSLNSNRFDPLKQNINTELEECASILSNKLFKDCISCIQTRNDLLKRAVTKHRNKKIDTKVQEVNYFRATLKEPHRIYRDISSEIIKKKLKEIYMKTQGNQNEYEEDYHESRKRNTFVDSDRLKQGTQILRNTEQIFKNRGVMKKVHKGQLRRVQKK